MTRIRLLLLFVSISALAFSKTGARELLRNGKAKEYLMIPLDTNNKEQGYYRCLANIFLNRAEAAKDILTTEFKPSQGTLVFVEDYSFPYSIDYDYCLRLFYKLRGENSLSTQYFVNFKKKLSDSESLDYVDFYIHQNENHLLYHDDERTYIQRISTLVDSDMGDEHSPVVLDNHLYFASNYDQKNQTQLAYDKAFSFDFKNSPVPAFPVLRKKEHSIQTEFTDGSILIYVQETKTKGNIYSSKLGELGYLKPEKLKGSINSKYLELSAYFVKQDSTLYFSSNRPGGFGGMDLYKNTLKKDGTWTEAQNLGDKINTEFNEDAPYFDFEYNMLYFSSNGDKSLGGYDLFKAERTEAGFESAYNLGSPMNSTLDDIFFTRMEDKVYFSSNRNPSKGMDIYELSLANIENKIYKWHITTFPENMIDSIPLSSCFSFEVEESAALEAPKSYYWIFNAIDTLEGRTVTHCFDNSSKAHVELVSITGKYEFVNVEKEYDLNLGGLKFFTEKGNSGEFLTNDKDVGFSILESYWRSNHEVFAGSELTSDQEADLAIFKIELDDEQYYIKVK